jgi:LPS sulfotransferase NodH
MEYFNFHAIMLEQVLRWQVTRLDVYVSTLLQRRTGPNGVFGVKCHFDQFHFLANVSGQFRRFKPARLIYVEREDAVAQAVSLAMALQTGQWDSFAEREREPVYDRSQIEQALQQIESAKAAWRRALAVSPVGFFEARYEALCADPERLVREVLAFLKIEGPPGALPTAPPLPALQSDPAKDAWLLRYRSGH